MASMPRHHWFGFILSCRKSMASMIDAIPKHVLAAAALACGAHAHALLFFESHLRDLHKSHRVIHAKSRCEHHCAWTFTSTNTRRLFTWTLGMQISLSTIRLSRAPAHICRFMRLRWDVRRRRAAADPVLAGGALR